MSDSSRDEELAKLTEDLETTLRELRNELHQPPRGPLGLPRPPTPRELLSFTGEYAIPTAIAVLEANIRALEMLERILHTLDPERSTVEGGTLQSRAEEVSRATLDRLQDALADVETAIQDGDWPRESEARRILEDARKLSQEIDDRLAAASESAADRSHRAIGDGNVREPNRPEVDVDAELASIRDELDDGGDDGDDENDESDGHDAGHEGRDGDGHEGNEE